MRDRYDRLLSFQMAHKLDPFPSKSLVDSISFIHDTQIEGAVDDGSLVQYPVFVDDDDSIVQIIHKLAVPNDPISLSIALSLATGVVLRHGRYSVDIIQLLQSPDLQSIDCGAYWLKWQPNAKSLCEQHSRSSKLSASRNSPSTMVHKKVAMPKNMPPIG